MKYIVYVDGACAVSLMLGGYAAIVENESGERVVVTGSKVKATNNEMEILAVIQGINAIPNLKSQDEVKVYSDDGSYRGGGKVYNAPKCNYLGYMSIYV